MTSVFFLQNSISLCSASFCTPRPNLPVTPGVSWLPTFPFQSPMMKRTPFWGVSSKRSYQNCSTYLASLVGAQTWITVILNGLPPIFQNNVKHHRHDHLSQLSISSRCVRQLLSCVRLFTTAWLVAHQAPLSMKSSRQEYWSGLSFPSPRDLPNPGSEPRSPALQVNSLLSEPPGKYCHLFNPLLLLSRQVFGVASTISPPCPFSGQSGIWLFQFY